MSLRLDAPETEAEFQQAVIELARTLGYAVAHFRPAKTSKGWRTPVAADGKGWPDLAIVGRGRIIYAELKSARGKLSPEQQEWLDRLERAGGESYVWRPEDFDQIVSVLTGKAIRGTAA